MAILKCLGSSSAGNCFLLDCEGEVLVLDLGIEFKRMLGALNYEVERVRGCLATHL